MKARSSDIRQRLDDVDRATLYALAEDYAADHPGRVIGLDDMKAMLQEHLALVLRCVRDPAQRRAIREDSAPVLSDLAERRPDIDDLPGVARKYIDRLPGLLLSREGAAAIFQTVRQAVFRQVHDPDICRAFDADADRIFRRYFDDRKKGGG